MSPRESALKQDFLRAKELLEAYLKAAETERRKLWRSWKPRTRKLIKQQLQDGQFGLLLFLMTEPRRGVGTFYRTEGGELLFLREADHRLYDVEQKTFERYLIQLTGSVVGVRHQWLLRLQAWVRFQAPEVKTHFLAYNDSPDLNVIAVNTFGGYMMLRNRGDNWRRVPNGTDGILFKTPPEFLTPWSASPKATGKDLEWLVCLANFSADGRLSVDDQRNLLLVWLLHLFAPALNPVHPIPLNEGETGSGKTVEGEMIGRWLTGPEFEVMDLPSGDATKAEESLKLALCKRPLVILDNVDSPSPWLEDFICRVATGVRMSRRRLYTDAEEVCFTPQAGFIITSRDPHVRREDVARRLLPLRFQLLSEDQRRCETDLREEVDKRRAGIWADVLEVIARVQDAWPNLNGGLKSHHSLADFSRFGALLAEVQGNSGEEWQAFMDRLQEAQSRFTTEEDPMAEILRAVLDWKKGLVPLQPVSKLYQTVKDEAWARQVSLPFKSQAALTKALKNKRHALECALDAKIVLDNHHHGGEYWVAITRVGSEEAQKSSEEQKPTTPQPGRAEMPSQDPLSGLDGIKA